MNVQSCIERFFQPVATSKVGKAGEAVEGGEADPLGRALESLYPAGCLERIGTMTDAEINEYAARYGVTGAELVAGIFDSGRNVEYMNRNR